MVVFTCSSCGQSVKKNQVEKHCSLQCRGCESLSCMDCGKVFWGDDYKEHTKCITEDQKYGGKDYQAKPSSNKGEVKQEKWIEHVKNVIATKQLSGPLKKYLEQIVLYSNIPRKRSKFENFLKNSLKLRNGYLIGEAWEIFAQSTSNEKNQTPQSPAVNGTQSNKEETPNNKFCSNETVVNSGQKRSLNNKQETPSKKFCSNETVVNELQKKVLNCPEKYSKLISDLENFKWASLEPVRKSEDFKWSEIITKVLLEVPENIVDMRTLRRVVTAVYYCIVKNATLSEQDVKKKFNEVVTNSSEFVLTKMK